MYWGFFLFLFLLPVLLLIGGIYNLLEVISTPNNGENVKSTAKKIGGSFFDLARITAYAVVPLGLYMVSIWVGYSDLSETINGKNLKVYNYFLVGILIVCGYQSLRFLLGYKSFYIQRNEYWFYLVIIPFFLPYAGAIFLRLANWIINLF